MPSASILCAVDLDRLLVDISTFLISLGISLVLVTFFMAISLVRIADAAHVHGLMVKNIPFFWIGRIARIYVGLVEVIVAILFD